MVAVWVAVVFVPLTMKSLVLVYSDDPNLLLLQVSDYLNEVVGPDDVIETYDSELISC